MRDAVVEIKTEEPAIRYINFDLLDRLTHTFDTEHILYDRYLDQCYRIDAGTSIIRRILLLDQIVDEIKIYRCIDFSEKMIFRNKLFQRYELHLRLFFHMLRNHWNLPFCHVYYTTKEAVYVGIPMI